MLKIEFADNRISINGKVLSYPFKEEELYEVLGKPRIHDVVKDGASMGLEYVWDKHGIIVQNIGGHMTEMEFCYSNQKSGDYGRTEPKKYFTGRLFSDGSWFDPFLSELGEPTEYGDFELRATAGWDDETKTQMARYMIMKNYKNVPVDPAVYRIKRPQGPILKFKDLNFKLLVIDELMYNQKVLKPQFDIDEFAKIYKKRKINVDKERERYRVIPEALAWFKRLPIPIELAERIKNLEQNANEIYFHIFPVYDGEGEDFIVRSAKDAVQFPNLKKVTLIPPMNADLSVPKEEEFPPIKELRAMKIKAEYL